MDLKSKDSKQIPELHPEYMIDDAPYVNVLSRLKLAKDGKTLDEAYHDLFDGKSEPEEFHY